MTIVEGEQLESDLVFRLANDFDDSQPTFFVDISILSQLTEPALKEHIQRVGKVIYQSGSYPTPS